MGEDKTTKEEYRLKKQGMTKFLICESSDAFSTTDETIARGHTLATGHKFRAEIVSLAPLMPEPEVAMGKSGIKKEKERER